MRARALAVLSVVVAALVAAGCGAGSQGSRGGKVPGDTLTVYTSLPFAGLLRQQGRDALNGEKLALSQAGGKIGKFTINIEALNDTEARSQRWTPAKVAANARQAANDQGTIAYIGELDTGGSSISVPILDEAGILQVSPGDTYGGLTIAEGLQAGEPDRFYPQKDRMFGRVVPNDVEQAGALAQWIKQQEGRRLVTFSDTSEYGKALREQLLKIGKGKGLAVVDKGEVEPVKAAEKLRPAAQQVTSARADSVFLGFRDPRQAGALARVIHEVAPTAKIFASASLALPQFVSAVGAAAPAVHVISPPQKLAGTDYDAFVADYKTKFKAAPTAWAAYGYSAMRTVLDSVRRAKGDAAKRDTVIKRFFDTRELATPLGKVTINKDGDTSLTSWEGYTIVKGALKLTEPTLGGGAPPT